MVRGEFFEQMERIKTVFGAEHFPEERMALIWNEVSDLSVTSFQRIVNHFIGNQNIKYPPKVGEFKEQALLQKKFEFSQTTTRAAESLDRKSSSWDGQALSRALKSIGAENLLDAVEKRKGAK